MSEKYTSPYPIYLENKAVFRAIPEKIINTGDFASAEKYIAHDYIEHVP